MSDYLIITDSTTDFPAAFVKERKLPVVELKYHLGDKTYSDDFGMSMDYRAFYDKVREGAMPTTSQVNISEYLDFFTPYLENGQDLLYIAFSSGLSGSCDSAMMAADELRAKYPQRKLIVVDSLCASMGEGLLVYCALKKKEEGLGIEALAKWLETNKKRLCHWFTVDDLHHLHRGGRLSKTSAVLGSLLGIKPVLSVDESGRLKVRDKVRGRRQSLDALRDKLVKYAENLKEQTVFISHADCAEDAEYLAGKVRTAGVRDVLISQIGPVIGAHSGPGTVAVFFFGKSREL